MMPQTPNLRLGAVRPDLFAPFGAVVEMGRPAVAVNGGTALRHDVDRFTASAARTGFSLVTSIYEATAQDLPRPVGLLERHRNSPQLIMPVSGDGHAVIACLSGPDGAPDLSTLAAFRFTARQGMVYRPGLWHHPILALGQPAHFLVQSWQDGTEADCEIVPIAPTTVVGD